MLSVRSCCSSSTTNTHRAAEVCGWSVRPIVCRRYTSCVSSRGSTARACTPTAQVISLCSVCGRAARAARLTAEPRACSGPRRLLFQMEARWRRDGGETEASWRRAGGELKASWRRDADGGETADADEVEARWQMEARDGGEMEARRQRRRRRGWRRRGWRGRRCAGEAAVRRRTLRVDRRGRELGGGSRP